VVLSRDQNSDVFAWARLTIGEVTAAAVLGFLA
jgi:hypothetical protein